MTQPYEALFRNFLKRWLKKYRKDHGLTQEQMAEKLSVSRRPYVYAESGGRSCSAATLMCFISILSEEELTQFCTEYRALLEEEAAHAFDSQ